MSETPCYRLRLRHEASLPSGEGQLAPPFSPERACACAHVTSTSQNNQVEEALRVLNRILGMEGIFDRYRLTRYYEKPTKTRRRINYEICKAIYDEDMARRIQFTLRKNRADPWLGND
ncbi:hypothetical protein MTO96_007523 [Rhipicephalus appendiculatus]